MPAGELPSRLEAFIASKHPQASGFRFISFDQRVEGLSWETYAIEAEWNEQGRRRQAGFVVRRVPQAGLLLAYNVTTQWEIHRAVEAIGSIPIPKALWVEPEGRVAGRPFYVMERVEGVVAVPGRARSFFPSDEVRHEIGRQLARIAAFIHKIPLQALPLDHLRGTREAARTGLEEVGYSRRIYESQCLVRVPLLEMAFAWLERNVKDVSGRLSLVHGDLRIGNFMMRDNKIVAILDWEAAHLGDPVEDLALCAQPFYWGHSPEVTQLLPLEESLLSYEKAVGWSVPRKALKYWTVYHLVQAAVTHITAARLFEDGRTNDIRYANMGHQIGYILRWLVDILGTGKAS